MTCTSSAATGTLQSGFSLPGANVGTITATTFTSCSGPLGLTFTVTQVGTWALNLTMSAAGVSTGYLSNISAQLSGSGCSATVAGAVDLRYTSQTRKLSVKPIAHSGNVLTISNVSGCAGLINNGDKATFTGIYAVAPPQIIIMGATHTPPAIAAGACPTPGVTLTPVAPAPNLAKLQTASLTSNVTRTVPANATSVTVSLLGFLNRGLDSVAVAFAAPGAVSCLTTTVTYQVGCNANGDLVFATLVDGKGRPLTHTTV